jgi:hypothetical protein
MEWEQWQQQGTLPKETLHDGHERPGGMVQQQ